MLSTTISQKICRSGYGRFRPNNADCHLWTLVLPRRLAPVLPTTYSPCYLHMAKALRKVKHLGFPYHTCVYCKVFAPAAPRGARASISVPFSGLPLSRPLPIIGLVVRYTTNNLIGRRLILGHEFEGNRLPEGFPYQVLASVSRGYP